MKPWVKGVLVLLGLVILVLGLLALSFVEIRFESSVSLPPRDPCRELAILVSPEVPIEQIEAALKQNPTCASWVAHSGYSLLHSAQTAGRLDIASVLLSHGATPGKRGRDYDGNEQWSALEADAASGRLDFVQLYVSSGTASWDEAVITQAIEYARRNGHAEVAELLQGVLAARREAEGKPQMNRAEPR